MNKIFLVFFIVSNLMFANMIELDNIRLNGNPPQLVVDVNGNKKPAYEINYDENNRLLFIEFFDTKASNGFTDKFVNGSYIDKIKVVKYAASTGVFVFFKKNVNYKGSFWSNPIRYVLDFSRKIDKKEYTVVIDPGHGGKDPGAIGFGRYKEKDIVLSVAKKLEKELKSDFNVVMTRDDDQFIPLSERARIGNRQQADIFVSLHANANASNNAKGFEIFYYSQTSSGYAKKVAEFENSVGERFGENTSDIARIATDISYRKNKEEAIKFSKQLMNKYCSDVGLEQRGDHGANFAVLRGFNGPGVLVELGFITNDGDVSKMKQSKYQEKMAESIANSIINYFYQ